MIRHCIHCGASFDDELTPLCPKCQGENRVERLDNRGIHKLHQSCHAHITEENQRFNAGMVNLIIGLILVVLGAIFFVLTFRYNVQRIRVFRADSVEFIISTICLTISAVLIPLGIVRIVKSNRRKKFYNKVIQDTDLKQKK